MLAVRAFENVDYSRRFRLYDLFSDILMDTHLTSVIEKRKNAALASSKNSAGTGSRTRR
ncbi:hypothetical protein NXW11_24740 [Bacteroides thetaiotaomicron]|uniref:hypothetical protein n=1 Tax=Bacteroides thetaiotaomicron TaxID=818 RepID=UPI002165C092|nr:hypothetical protein [Bacteroides thetaiotaomicron]